MKKTITLFILLHAVLTLFAQREYTGGVFIVNEDWYGHQNSTLNFLSNDGEWTYRVFQLENPGMELGCTSQFGTIHDGKFYIVSKQEKDPGAQITGGRLTVCDAKTMKCIKQFPVISLNEKGKSNADGRAFLGIGEKKGYISSSNGIYIFDIENMEVGAQIKGSDNPEDAGYGSLYHGQVGNMALADNYVFAVHQSQGILIIDPAEDKLIGTIQAPNEYDASSGKYVQRGFGSVVKSKNNNLWISVCANQSGSGAACEYMFRLHPSTLDTVRVELPAGWAVPNSWYAWTADGFCASAQENKLYWKNNAGWFASTKIYSYNIDNDTFDEIYDTSAIGWSIYGAGFRIHPVTDEIYCSLYHEFLEPTYQTVRISAQGVLLSEHSMINNYWFPAMPVFPEIKYNDNSAGHVEVAHVKVYPNPANAYIIVNTQTDSEINIHDLAGKTILSTISSGESTEIDIRAFEKGMYLIKTATGSTKFIKQ
jgi:hypothetical protein